MTKKDFEFIAGVLAVQKDSGEAENKRKEIAEYFGFQLSQMYPTFNREKFLKACGLEV